MKNPILAAALSILLAAFAASACAARREPTPLRVVCTVATIGKPELCFVEFGPALGAYRVQTASRAEAKKLVLILLASPGAVYYLDDGRAGLRLRGRR
jgi:hypothetical protein